MMDKNTSQSVYSQLHKKKDRLQPSLVLSKKARTSPLKTPWLNELRDFFCRTGAWRNHPIESVELFAASPAPGVENAEGRPNVIGPSQPVFTSLGFGAKGVRNGRVEYDAGVCAELRLPSICDALLCTVNSSDPDAGPPCNVLDRSGGRIALDEARPRPPACLVLEPPEQPESEEGADAAIPPQCLTLDPAPDRKKGTSQRLLGPTYLTVDPIGRASTCYDSFCGGETCFEQDCRSHKCSTNTCDKHSCEDHVCGSKSQFLKKATAKSVKIAGSWQGELAADEDHPFVQELMDYFGAKDHQHLEASVLNYIGGNMFARFSDD